MVRIGVAPAPAEVVAVDAGPGFQGLGDSSDEEPMPAARPQAARPQTQRAKAVTRVQVKQSSSQEIPDEQGYSENEVSVAPKAKGRARFAASSSVQPRSRRADGLQPLQGEVHVNVRAQRQLLAHDEDDDEDGDATPPAASRRSKQEPAGQRRRQQEYEEETGDGTRAVGSRSSKQASNRRGREVTEAVEEEPVNSKKKRSEPAAVPPSQPDFGESESS